METDWDLIRRQIEISMNSKVQELYAKLASQAKLIERLFYYVNALSAALEIGTPLLFSQFEIISREPQLLSYNDIPPKPDTPEPIQLPEPASENTELTIETSLEEEKEIQETETIEEPPRIIPSPKHLPKPLSVEAKRKIAAEEKKKAEDEKKKKLEENRKKAEEAKKKSEEEKKKKVLEAKTRMEEAKKKKEEEAKKKKEEEAKKKQLMAEKRKKDEESRKEALQKKIESTQPVSKIPSRTKLKPVEPIEKIEPSEEAPILPPEPKIEIDEEFDIQDQLQLIGIELSQLADFQFEPDEEEGVKIEGEEYLDEIKELPKPDLYIDSLPPPVTSLAIKLFLQVIGIDMPDDPMIVHQAWTEFINSIEDESKIRVIPEWSQENLDKVEAVLHGRRGLLDSLLFEDWPLARILSLYCSAALAHSGIWPSPSKRRYLRLVHKSSTLATSSD